MVHDLVRDAISDVIGKLLSKATITVITAGLAAPWMVQSVISDVASWVTRLSKDIASTVLSAKNLKNLLDKATTLLDDVAAAFARIPAKSASPTPPPTRVAEAAERPIEVGAETSRALEARSLTCRACEGVQSTTFLISFPTTGLFAPKRRA